MISVPAVVEGDYEVSEVNGAFEDNALIRFGVDGWVLRRMAEDGCGRNPSCSGQACLILREELFVRGVCLRWDTDLDGLIMQIVIGTSISFSSSDFCS